MCNAAGDIEAAKQAAGELLGALFDVVLQAGGRQCLLHQLLPFCRIRDVKPAEIVHVLIDAQPVKYRDVLKYDADLLFQLVGRGRHLLPEEADLSAVVGQQRQNTADGRAFAGAVRPEQAEDFALLDVQIQMIQRRHVAVAFYQSFDLQHSNPSSFYACIIAGLLPGR